MNEKEIKKLTKIVKFNIKDNEKDYILYKLDSMSTNLKCLDKFSLTNIFYNIKNNTF